MKPKDKAKHNVFNFIQTNPYCSDKEWKEYNREYNLYLRQYTKDMTYKEYMDYYRKVWAKEKREGQMMMFEEIEND